jgi:hypothetical protein
MPGLHDNRTTLQNDWERARRRARGLSALVAAALLLLGSGCTMLDLTPKLPTPPPTRSPEQITPPVVVTVGGGSPAESTPTPGTAPTIPDSTPLPRLEIPTRDAAAQSSPAPTATARTTVSAAARASQPPPIAVPVARSSPTPGR